MVPSVSAGEFTIEFLEDDDGRSPVEEWMDSDLTDLELAALVSGLEHVLSHRGIDVCRTEWGKQLGEGLFEFRIRHSAAEIEHMFTGTSSSRQAAKGEKVLLRVFCHAYGAKVVLLLNGYDKAGDSGDKTPTAQMSARAEPSCRVQRAASPRSARGSAEEVVAIPRGRG